MTDAQEYEDPKRLRQVLEDQRALNRDNHDSLRKKGADLEMLGIVLTRVNVLYDALLGPEDESDNRATVELMFEQAIGQQLEAAHREVAKARLSANGRPGQGPPPGKLIIPN